METDRAGQLEYFIVYIGAAFIFKLGLTILQNADYTFSETPLTYTLGFSIALIGAIAAFYVTIRRLHDIEKPEVLVFLVAIPVINILFFLYLLFTLGKKGSNRYGPEPQKLFVKDKESSGI
jgi:uncharacterized membrane protein YhaH (DUF805 family)